MNETVQGKMTLKRLFRLRFADLGSSEAVSGYLPLAFVSSVLKAFSLSL
jgi:hypothetical protein